jgi:hypothetical protein
LAKPWQNNSGCNDPTAYAATKPTEEEIQVGKLVKAVKAVSDLFGFEIINRVEFRSKHTGKCYR